MDRIASYRIVLLMCLVLACLWAPLSYASTSKVATDLSWRACSSFTIREYPQGYGLPSPSLPKHHTPKRTIASLSSRPTREPKIDVQVRIVLHCERLGLNARETAFVLALCEVESSFNPVARNPKSSAKGLFQFIDATRIELARRAGVSAKDPFCIELQLACLTEQLKEAFPVAERKAGGRSTDEFFAWAYAYHHDGPSFRHGGYTLACKRILPKLDRYECLVMGMRELRH